MITALEGPATAEKAIYRQSFLAGELPKNQIPYSSFRAPRRLTKSLSFNRHPPLDKRCRLDMTRACHSITSWVRSRIVAELARGVPTNGSRRAGTTLLGRVTVRMPKHLRSWLSAPCNGTQMRPAPACAAGEGGACVRLRVIDFAGSIIVAHQVRRCAQLSLIASRPPQACSRLCWH